jgi:tetratricopeptide (TPR) repeat protein
MKNLILIISFLVGFSSLTYGQSEPPYGMSQLEAYSLFYENYRTGDYEMALTFGQWILEAKPREIQGHRSFSLDTQFNRLINVYVGLAENESDPSEKARLLGQAMEIYDLVHETFEEDEIDMFRWTIRQGQFYQENHRDLDDGIQRAYDHYEKAYEMDRQQFAETSDGYYARLLLNNYVSQNERDKALAFIDVVEDYAGETLMQSIEEARNELFQDPEERIAFLEERLDQREDREEALTELATLYDRIGDRAKAHEIAVQLYEINPNFENTRKLADAALTDANYNEALNYLSEALDKAPNDNSKKRIALEISRTYQNLDNLQSARQYARQAIDIDSNFGDAYMRMADIYAAAISSCTSGRSIERDDRTVYWLVVDYLERARDVDSSTRNAANRQINSYTPVMPTSEDKFFRGWDDGDTFTIDGSVGECYAWINETTTVR